MAFDAFMERIGRSRTVGYFWRKKGWLNAGINIDGSLFVEDSEIQRFWRRARAGEFAGDERGIVVDQKRKKGRKR
jgi:hypothetical protein